MGKNVLLPLSVVTRIIDLLGYWDISRYDRAIRDDYDFVLQELQLKLKKLELRSVYSTIVNANDDDARDSARIDYLWHKNYIKRFYVDNSDI